MKAWQEQCDPRVAIAYTRQHSKALTSRPDRYPSWIRVDKESFWRRTSPLIIERQSLQCPSSLSVNVGLPGFVVCKKGSQLQFHESIQRIDGR